jgi:hypothetical protein
MRRTSTATLADLQPLLIALALAAFGSILPLSSAGATLAPKIVFKDGKVEKDLDEPPQRREPGWHQGQSENGSATGRQHRPLASRDAKIGQRLHLQALSQTSSADGTRLEGSRQAC